MVQKACFHKLHLKAQQKVVDCTVLDGNVYYRLDDARDWLSARLLCTVTSLVLTVYVCAVPPWGISIVIRDLPEGRSVGPQIRKIYFGKCCQRRKTSVILCACRCKRETALTNNVFVIVTPHLSHRTLSKSSVRSSLYLPSKSLFERAKKLPSN